MRRAGNGVALFVVGAHLLLVVYSLARKPANVSEFWEDFNASAHAIPIAGRAVDIPNEAPLVKTIFWLDLPSLAVFYVISFFLFMLVPTVTIETLSWIVAAILFVLTSAQWWLVGCGIEKGFKLIGKKRGGGLSAED